MDKAKCLVRFKDTLEKHADEHFGILFEDGEVLCLCCGGVVEAEDRRILKQYDGFAYLDDTLKQYY